MQSAAASNVVQSGQEHGAKDVKNGVVEQNEHPKIFSKGQAGAVAKGQGMETWIREEMQPVEVTGPERGETPQHTEPQKPTWPKKMHRLVEGHLTQHRVTTRLQQSQRYSCNVSPTFKWLSFCAGEGKEQFSWR
jgi:hypothetical protein